MVALLRRPSHVGLVLCLACLTGLSLLKPAMSLFGYTYYCMLTPWRKACDNPIQLRFLGMAMFTSGRVGNLIECMGQETKDACEKANTTDSMKCGWYETPTNYVEQFGAGGCTLKSMSDNGGCAYLPRLAFEPAISLGLTLLPPAEEAACLKHSGSERECTTHSQCRYCVLPDAYGWKDMKNACMSKKLMPANDDARNWCVLAQKVPKRARSTNIVWSEEAA